MSGGTFLSGKLFTQYNTLLYNNNYSGKLFYTKIQKSFLLVIIGLRIGKMLQQQKN